MTLAMLGWPELIGIAVLILPAGVIAGLVWVCVRGSRKPTYAPPPAPSPALSPAPPSASPSPPMMPSEPQAPSRPLPQILPLPDDPTFRYAGFWRRVAASLFDVIALSVPISILSVLLLIPMFGLNSYLSNARAQLLFEILAVLGISLYFSVMEASPLQATLGKLAVGIKVTDMDGSRIGFWRAFGRDLAKMLSGTIFCFGYVMAGLTARKQALHDIVANCLVIRSPSPAAPVSLSTIPRPIPQQHQPLSTDIVYSIPSFSRFGLALAITGLFVPIVCLPLADGYRSNAGLLVNIQTMSVPITGDEHEPDFRAVENVYQESGQRLIAYDSGTTLEFPASTSDREVVSAVDAAQELRATTRPRFLRFYGWKVKSKGYSLPYRYIASAGVLLMLVGSVTIIFSTKRKTHTLSSPA